MCLMLGDDAYDSEYNTGFYPICPTMLRKILLRSCLGNCDANNGVTAPTTTFRYFDMFTLPTNGECGGGASGREHYRPWDYGNIDLISFGSQTTLVNSTAPADHRPCGCKTISRARRRPWSSYSSVKRITPRAATIATRKPSS